LDHRANPNAQDAFGNTAMFEAVRMGHEHIITLLNTHRVK
jgi:ankyrin repeat protein